MKSFRTLFLLFVVLGLGGYIYFHERHLQSTEAHAEEMMRAFSVDLERADRLLIRLPEYEVDIRRVGGEWRMSEPSGALAQESLIRQLLSRLRGLPRGQLISPADMRAGGYTLADFGLATPKAVLAIQDHRGLKEYRIGNPNPLETELYIKEEGSQHVMLVSTDLLEILPRSASDLRDRRITTFATDRIDSFSLIRPEGVLRMEKRGNDWRMLDPGRHLADAAAVQEWLHKITTARIETFVEGRAGDLETYGLDTPVAEIRIHPSNGESPVELQLGRPAEGRPGQRYARFAGKEGVFVVSEGVMVLALSDSMSFRDRRVMTLDVSRIVQVRISEEGSQMTLRKSDDAWKMVSPLERPASAAHIQRMLEIWESGMIESVLPMREGATALYRVNFHHQITDGEGGLTFDVLQPSDSVQGRTWLKPVGTDEIWQVIPENIAYTPRDPIAYLSRDVLRFQADQVIRISIQRGEDTVVFHREQADKPWRLSDNARGLPNETVIENMLKQASNLRARELLSLNGPGVLTPEQEATRLRISFGLSGDAQANRTLLIYEDPANQRRYAKVQGRDLLFTLQDDVEDALYASPVIPLSSEESDDETSNTENL
ncbi:MAG: DUF4340 domain-containing protein [Verrucomicrobia bacterium]|nr:DUF4340 domain-containing protein [Verrucomicrobiota bacterium]MCH8510387.1 DUF4340 domain-containing protein [Kiritimatiellia bacterium]